MANLYLTGLPQSKDLRQSVKTKLREILSPHGKVIGLNWGSRRGTCYVGMDSPMSASTVIAKVYNDKKVCSPYLYFENCL